MQHFFNYSKALQKLFSNAFFSNALHTSDFSSRFSAAKCLWKFLVKRHHLHTWYN